MCLWFLLEKYIHVELKKKLNEIFLPSNQSFLSNRNSKQYLPYCRNVGYIPVSLLYLERARYWYGQRSTLSATKTETKFHKCTKGLHVLNLDIIVFSVCHRYPSVMILKCKCFWTAYTWNTNNMSFNLPFMVAI